MQRMPTALLPEDFSLQLVLTDLPGAMQRMPLEDLWGLLQVLLIVLLRTQGEALTTMQRMLSAQTPRVEQK